jgi:hypothetical protein
MQQTLNFIFPASTGLSSFRDAGYRDTSMAIAELIDNSIQAGAKTIRVITIDEVQQSRASKQVVVNKIAVFDDGEGMSKEVLELSLGFAQGTRLNQRKGIGRFGVGLPLASISQCKRVSVYSWQKGKKPMMTYLDIDEVIENKQNYTNAAIEAEIPKIYSDILGKKIKKSGTLVVWENCDRINLKRSSTLLRRMESGFCRIYRHYLDDNDDYGDRRDIKLLQADGKTVKEHPLVANDPLYILTPNNLPKWEKKPSNKSYLEEPLLIDVEYNEAGDTSPVEIFGSHILQNPGRWKRDSPQMDHYRKNVGISFMREGREIDFGNFGYLSTDLTERYWGVEVRFSPELDELFGVTNNKQAVRGVNYLGDEELADYDDDFIQSDLSLKFRKALSQRISVLIRQLRKEVKNNAATGWTDEIDDKEPTVNLPASEESETATEALGGSKDKTKTKTEAAGKSEKEKDAEIEAIIKASNPNLSKKALKSAVEAFKKLDLAISYKTWPGEQFMTIEGVAETCVAVINRQHAFYEVLYEEVCGGKDTTTAQAMNLLLMAYARAEDEMYNDAEVLEKFRSKWGGWVSTFLKRLKE